MVLPEKVINYNVYSAGEKLIGIAAEVTLPKLEPMAEEISGAGILGMFSSPTPGHFGSMQTEITFNAINDKSFSLMNPNGQTIMLRASQQGFDVSAGRISYRPLKITMIVYPAGMELGTLAVGKPTGTKNTLEILYLKIEENGSVLLELDKLNFVYTVNGVDILAAVRRQI